MKTTNTGQVRSKELLGGWWGHIKAASTFCLGEKGISDSSSSLWAFVTLQVTKVGDNRHFLVHLMLGKDHLQVAHRFAINETAGQSLSNSSVYMIHQEILRCCWLGWGLRVYMSDKFPGRTHAAGSQTTLSNKAMFTWQFAFRRFSPRKRGYKATQGQEIFI